MGFSHSTYFAYGTHVPFNGHPGEEGERADTVLAGIKEQCPDVGYLCAGAYDHDMYFLVTECTEVDLGEFKHVTPQAADTERLANWNRQLSIAARALGYDDPGEPGWLTVPDMS